MKDPNDDKTIDMFEDASVKFYCPYEFMIMDKQQVEDDQTLEDINYFRKRFLEACSAFKPKIKECDHIYFPVLHELTKKPVGQQCSICGKFNSIEDLSRHSSVGRAHSW